MVSLNGILNDPQIPQIQYDMVHIESKIGAGANGTVYRGTLWYPNKPPSSAIPIAIKELDMSHVIELDYSIREFLTEIKFLR